MTNVPPPNHSSMAWHSRMVVSLIQEALAVRRTAEARDTIRRSDLAFELVVVSKFVVCGSC